MTFALAGVAAVAAAATLADFIWYSAGVRHTMLAGLVHGALLLTVVGATLGAASGRLVRGLPIGALAGVGGALAYYVLVAVMDARTYGTAIPGAWVTMWLLLAALDGRWLRAPHRRPWSEIAGRGMLAAVASGAAFALVRGVLWGRPAGSERSYAVQFAMWAFAWAPGLVVLLWPRGGASTPTIAPRELWVRIERGDAPAIVDVRSHLEYVRGHVPGAINVPFHTLGARLARVPGVPDEELFLYCGHGPRASVALDVLRAAGRTRVVVLEGHYAAWRRARLAEER